MAKVKLTIDNNTVEVEQGTSVLEAARQIGIKIPTLCYLKEINVIGACRLCIVKVQGARSYMASCTLPAAEGMVIWTHTPGLRQARRMIMELILSDHPMECLTCMRHGRCELQTMAESLGVRDIRFQRVSKTMYEKDESSPSIIREPKKCIYCRRCVSVCNSVQTVHAIGPQLRGFNTVIAPPYNLPLDKSVCVNCGQCSLVCPVGAIYEKDDTDRAWAALADPSKHVVVQTAPATRVTMGEAFGLPPGTPVTGRMVAALRRLGFDRVFDTDFTADLTIIEEGNELLHRVKNGGVLPQITSCSPGWIKFIEHFYPELLDHLSSAKSPQQMFGSLAKTFYAQKAGIDPKDIVVVSIMPCTAKKYEALRPEMEDSGYRDVDIVLTSRELGRMLKEACIDLANLPDEEYDDPLGLSTGAAAIFGATGGVMEAALRTVYEVVTGETLGNIDLVQVRGLEGIKEATIDLKGLPVKVLVAHGLKHARALMDRLKAGELKDYHFIEVMCCPGGCIGGGGQPIGTNSEMRQLRIDGIYKVDSAMEYRKSHENPAVKELYEQFLGEPLSEKSHHLLHTKYTGRSNHPEIGE
ncbi:MAG: [FeFe] hydrogenase, group A [Firmicutes bacterium]|nr:[FeFe] hydrogenase, group A [Bacillota bacterium]MBU4533096.1 [FeFe] hydrogenase, group A [Bacillota bacterium]MBV1727042.1 [FeFe] hydrogenase, group A [Desulforudis sp.]MBV1735190.1 [FeFe] hydrogenase, group A [Desulforudis sp.]MBV1769545.1 [FeFe] hydrogenase, group A [Desulforudis sp.]